jgi:hypothetical protein
MSKSRLQPRRSIVFHKNRATAPCPNLAFGHAGRSASALDCNCAHSITGRPCSITRHRLPQNGVLFRLAPRRCHAKGHGGIVAAQPPDNRMPAGVSGSAGLARTMDWEPGIWWYAPQPPDSRPPCQASHQWHEISSPIRCQRPMTGRLARPATAPNCLPDQLANDGSGTGKEALYRWTEHDGIDIRAGSRRVAAVGPPIRPGTESLALHHPGQFCFHLARPGVT